MLHSRYMLCDPKPRIPNIPQIDRPLIMGRGRRDLNNSIARNGKHAFCETNRACFRQRYANSDGSRSRPCCTRSFVRPMFMRENLSNRYFLTTFKRGRHAYIITRRAAETGRKGVSFVSKTRSRPYAYDDGVLFRKIIEKHVRKYFSDLFEPFFGDDKQFISFNALPLRRR